MIFAAALAVYAALMAVTWEISTSEAGKKTEFQLSYAVTDMYDTVGGAIDTMLIHVARTAVRHIGRARPMAMERVAAGAKELDIDEISVVDRSGVVIASNDPLSMGVVMAGDPVLDEFMQLTNGVTETVSQAFRPHARNPKFRAKYLAVAFPGGDGFVQVGLAESRLARMLPEILEYVFDEWLLGRTGFFLCADRETGRIVSIPSHFRCRAKTLSDAGYDAAATQRYEVIADGKTVGETFTQHVFGEKCYCKALTWAGHRFVAVVPEREHYDTRTVFICVFGVLMFLILGAFALFLDRIFRDSDRLKAFYAAEEVRRAKDMTIAKTIQNAALPAAVPESPSYRLCAAMLAAREIGGDFYDYFQLDAVHLAFLVADVSGKGVTAALYMMTAKTLIKDALIAVHDPAAALTKVNSELCRNNQANMFVTAWVGVVDLETGVVTYANAGHNPPVALPSCTFAVEKSGPVLAFLDGVSYKPHTIRLAPGDALFLYTDGVTEALDSKGALFGEDRLLESLKVAAQAEPASICNIVRVAVAAFAEGVPQADDITVLALRYIAPPRKFSRSFPPTKEGIAAVSAFIDEVIAAPFSELAALHVIADEMCSNIVRHSGATGFEVKVEIEDDLSGITLTFVDDGVEYDPLAHADPDTTLPAEKRPIGGLGIMLVKKMSDSISYRRAHSRNILVVRRAARASGKP